MYTVVDPGETAGKETNTDLSLTNKENEAREATLPGKTGPRGCACSLCCIRVPYRALGLPHVMPLAGVEKPSETVHSPGWNQAQTSGASADQSRGIGWGRGQTLREFPKPSSTPSQPPGLGPAGSYKFWAGWGPQTKGSLRPCARGPLGSSGCVQPGIED